MSLKLEDRKLRLEINRRRTTKCAMHGCRDCRFEGCYSPGRSRARWMPPDERTIKPPVKPMPVPGPVPTPATLATLPPMPSPLPATKTVAEPSEDATVAAEADWANSMVKSRSRAAAAGLLAAFKHPLGVPWARRSK
jgi:hypothetical protein